LILQQKKALKEQSIHSKMTVLVTKWWK